MAIIAALSWDGFAPTGWYQPGVFEAATAIAQKSLSNIVSPTHTLFTRGSSNSSWSAVYLRNDLSLGTHTLRLLRLNAYGNYIRCTFDSRQSFITLPTTGKLLFGFNFKTSGTTGAARRPLTSVVTYDATGQGTSVLTASSAAMTVELNTWVFLEVHIDFENGIASFYLNGVESFTRSGLSIVDVSISVKSTISDSDSQQTYSDLGHMLFAHNPPGGPNPTLMLSGMEVHSLPVSSLTGAGTWTPSDPNTGIVDTLNRPLNPAVSDSDTPYVTIDPDAQPGIFTFDPPAITGNVKFVSLGVRAGSAPGHADRLYAKTQVDNGASVNTSLATNENMASSLVYQSATAPDGSDWTMSKLQSLTLSVNSAPIFQAGDKQAGYFGVVNQSDFITAEALMAGLNFNAGLAFETAENLWLSFAYNGKLLMFPRQPLRYELAWQDIYAAGLAYGVQGYGPATPEGVSNTNQFTTIDIQGEPWLVRLMKTAAGGSSSISIKTSNASDFAKMGEFADLLYRLSVNYPKADPWGAYDNAFLANGGGSNLGAIMYGASDGVTIENARWTYTKFYASYALTASVDASNPYTRHGWRPVLERLRPL